MVACKKIFEGKLSIKEARKQQNAMEKKIKDLNDWLNYSGPGKGMNPSTKKKKQKFYVLMQKIFILLEKI